MTGRFLVALIAGLVLSLGVWSATAIGAGTAGHGAFSDDDGSVHEPNINGLAASEISKGCNPPQNTHYCPERPVTRAEMATFLVRGLNLGPTSDNPFNDTGTSVHQNAIAALAQSGITKGCNPPQNTHYCPERPVTRAEMATFLVRGLNLGPTSDNPFNDTGTSVHQNAIAALAQSGITKGCNPPQNTHYCPERPVTRAEMATFLVRGLDDLDPLLNLIAMGTGMKCTKDGLSCSGRTNLASGVQLEVTEGWHQALPYLEGEESAFLGSGTRVDFTWNGSTLGTTFFGMDENSTLATRTWRARPPALTPGTHSLRAVWRWNGVVARTATWTITTP